MNQNLFTPLTDGTESGVSLSWPNGVWVYRYTARVPGVDSLTVNTQYLRSFTRLTRVAIALVTVWCLGCGAFEPLVASLTRTASPGMNCGQDQTGGSVPSRGALLADEGGGSSHDPTVAALDQHDRGSYSYSCDSCYSLSPVTISLALSPLPAPNAIVTTAALFESVEREPLVPPPQLLS